MSITSHPRRSLHALMVFILIISGWIPSVLRGADPAGAVIAWGTGTDFNPAPRSGFCEAVQIVSSSGLILSLKPDGRLEGRIDLAQYGFEFLQSIALGGNTVVGLRADGLIVQAVVLHDGRVLWSSGLRDVGPVRTIAVSGSVPLIVRADGTVARWMRSGPNEVRLTEVEGVFGVVELAACRTHVAALRSDGTVQCWAEAWGNNHFGQTNVPAGLSRVRSVAVGDGFTLALRTDGSLVQWGGAPRVPADLMPLRSIAAGSDHVVGLGTDGSVVAWGDNGHGQTNVPARLPAASGVGAGPWVSYAIVPRLPPMIRSSPDSQMRSEGETAVFRSETMGACPQTYQWSRNGVEIPGATSATLELFPVRLEDDGFYSARITNPFGSVTTSAAELVVNDVTVETWGKMDPSGVPAPRFLSRVSAVAAGSAHALALRRDGTVVGWGNNDSGQASPPQSLRDAVLISAGGQHSVAVRRDGTVVAWGDNSSGQCDVPAGLGAVQSVSAGVRHTLALRGDGTVSAWGGNREGECVVPPGLSNVVMVSAGQEMSAALRRDGTVAVWGRNSSGLLSVPTDLRDVTAIAAGWYHLLALKRDGTVVAWGEDRAWETQVPSDLRGVIAVDASERYSLALKSDRTVVVWGERPFGFFGLSQVDGIAAGSRHVVAMVSPPHPVRITRHPVAQSVPAGADAEFSVAVRGTPPFRYQWFRNGSLMPRQTNDVLRLSQVSTSSAGSYRVDVSNSSGAQTSGEVALGILGVPSGLVRGWGSRSFRETTTPVNLDSVRSVAAGNHFSVALRQDGTVIAWGDSTRGQTMVPTGLAAVRAIAAGESHVVAILNDDTLVAWGSNLFGQATVPAGLDHIAMVAAGAWHNLALRRSGEVIAWGNPDAGRTRVPPDLAAVEAVAAGGAHSLALTRNGRVVAWGSNQFGQASVPDGLTNVTAVAAGFEHSVALLRGGTVVCWGRNSSGESTPPDGLVGVKAVAAGNEFSVALQSDGTLVAWGSGDSGRTGVPSVLRGVTAVASGWSHSLALQGAPAPVILLSTEEDSLELTLQVNPGWRYRLEGSSNLRDWVSMTGEFLAPAGTIFREVPVDTARRFLRLTADP